MLKSEYLEKYANEHPDDFSDDTLDLADLSDYFNYPKKFKKGRIKEIYVAS
ncbi:hypothetical protein HY500_01435 [Candidatus Woesearchaeota archaeon]|nr:hypothetical protein [Candidatus Woesearchaeota archaeon]